MAVVLLVVAAPMARSLIPVTQDSLDVLRTSNVFETRDAVRNSTEHYSIKTLAATKELLATISTVALLAAAIGKDGLQCRRHMMIP